MFLFKVILASSSIKKFPLADILATRLWC